MPDAAIQALLKRWLPERTIMVRRADSGVSTPVYRVDASPGGATYYLRLAEEAGELREAEAHVHRLLATFGLPVPEILAREAEPPELDRSAMLTTLIPGRALRDCAGVDPSLVHAAAHAAGRDLARINRVSVRGFGWVQRVASSGTALLVEHPTRSAWTAEYARALATVATTNILSRAATDRLHSVLNRWLDRPDQATSALAHGDIDATHIYVEERTSAYTGIIDFGEIRGAEQLYDLGHALLQDHHSGASPIFPGLLAGYQEITPLPDGILVAIREQAIAIATRQLAIFFGRSAPQTPSLTLALEELLKTAK